ncbi:MAG: hypothetical protein ACTH30_15240 [Leucobacter sp.]
MPDDVNPSELDGEGADTLKSEPTQLLAEFVQLWNRGLASVEKLWQLFDICEMYLQRPEYFGAPIFNVGGQLITPVFSSQERLAAFIAETGQIDLDDPRDSYDWVRLSGAKVFGLPVRARYLCIDPGSGQETVVDLRSRENPPSIAHGAPPLAINLELLPDGTVGGGPTDLDLSDPEKRN